MKNAELVEWIEKGSKVLISDDWMTAELYLCPPPESMSYDLDIILQILAKSGIKRGVREERIKRMLADKLYYVKCLVAVGEPALDGQDGHFDFLFDAETNKKPRILPDGSVDYRTMTNIPTVKEGAIIARYTPATKGKSGYDLAGKEVAGKDGKELPEIKGKGFCTSDDKRSYMATMSGRIEFENGRITIKNFLEISEDVDVLTGDIDFDGDVLVHGSVTSGRKIRAGGTLTVQGSVEAIRKAVLDIQSDKVECVFLNASAGPISESDVLLASSSDAVILGFNVKVEANAVKLLKREGVQVKLYSIVYELIDQVRDAMLGLLEPETRETIIGHAKVLQVFKLNKGRAAGCMVEDGKILRSCEARVIRDKTPVFDGKMSTLRRFQDEVEEVKAGLESGIRLGDFNEYETGDIIECYTLEKIQQTL